MTGALRRAKLKQPADLVGWAKAENAKMEAAKKPKEEWLPELERSNFQKFTNGTRPA